MKAVIVDLDRTLLRTDKTISEYTLGIMEKCHAYGIAVMAATARPERAVTEYSNQIHFDAITTLNGARVILPGKVLENSISRESGERILAELTEVPDATISVEMSDGIYSNTHIPLWNPIIWDGFPHLPEAGALYKILVSGANILCGGVERILTDDVYHTVAEGELVQIMSRSATKWNGVREMLGALGIPESETAYFGDDNDDIEPIRMCGMGVAVANAIDAVTIAADCVVGSNDEDGVAHFIENNLL